MKANVNKHGSWIMLVYNGEYVHNPTGKVAQVTYHSCFCDVDSAAKFMHEHLVGKNEISEQDFEEWVGCLAENKPGSVDCFHSFYPIVWYDPRLDDGDFAIEGDYDAWEDWVSKLKSDGKWT